MVTTESGISIDSRLVQPLKFASRKTVIESGITTAMRLVQPSKTNPPPLPPPSSVTESLMMTHTKLVHCPNALVLTVPTELGI